MIILCALIFSANQVCKIYYYDGKGNKTMPLITTSRSTVIPPDLPHTLVEPQEIDAETLSKLRKASMVLLLRGALRGVCLTINTSHASIVLQIHIITQKSLSSRSLVFLPSPPPS